MIKYLFRNSVWLDTRPADVELLDVDRGHAARGLVLGGEPASARDLVERLAPLEVAHRRHDLEASLGAGDGRGEADAGGGAGDEDERPHEGAGV